MGLTPTLRADQSSGSSAGRGMDGGTSDGSGRSRSIEVR
jgi:hypothetical protein